MECYGHLLRTLSKTHNAPLKFNGSKMKFPLVAKGVSSRALAVSFRDPGSPSENVKTSIRKAIRGDDCSPRAIISLTV